MVVPTRKRELLNRITGQGLQACYRFTRRPHPYSESMLAVELEFSNTTDSAMGPISVGSPKLPMGMEMKAVGEIPQLPPGNSLSMTVGINFNDSLQLAKFDIRCVGVGVRGWWEVVGAVREVGWYFLGMYLCHVFKVFACLSHAQYHR